jgi:hypothetical protein
VENSAEYVESLSFLLYKGINDICFPELLTLSTEFSPFLLKIKNYTNSIFLLKNIKSENKVTQLTELAELITKLILFNSVSAYYLYGDTMRYRLFGVLEIIGAVVCAISVCLLSDLYELTGKNPIGILFGCVNGSIWESLKPLILSYFVFAGLELLSAKPYFRRFTASKAIGLYIVCVLYILFVSLTPIKGTAAVFICELAGFVISAILMKKNTERLYCLGCFMLLLVFVCYFSFSANPPRVGLFIDPLTGMYGIIPENIDIGAFRL